ncbi:MAG: hypothetical protein ACYC5Y_09565 [Symbiobacteriia bacterium]
MKKNLRTAALLISGSALVVGVTWYGLTTRAEAACGASASSCKTCHEVQGKDPVAKKGDWHVQHAFGDFCEFCHGGVTKETTAEKAHQGMRKPLEDPQKSCGSCHAPDLAQRVGKYGGAVTAATGTSTTPATSSGNGNTPAPPPPASPAPSAAASSADVPKDVLDFNRRLPGEPESPNRGNQVLWGLNALAAAGLAGIVWKEKRPKTAAKRPARTGFGDALGTALPAEHAELVTLLARCDALTLQALEQVLSQNGGAAFLKRLSQMDLSLVERLEHMSQEELSLALSLARGQKN